MPQFNYNGATFSHYSYIVMPYSPRGSLFDLIADGSKKQRHLALGW
jgi:hypothetical protein